MSETSIGGQNFFPCFLQYELTSKDSKGSIVTRVSESDSGTLLEAKSVDVLLRDIESNGNGENVTVLMTVERGKSESLNDAIGKFSPSFRRNCGRKTDLRSVVLLVHETFKRRETTVQDKLEVTQLTLYRVSHSSAHLYFDAPR